MCNSRPGAIPPRANPHAMRLRAIDRARIPDASTGARDDRVKNWRISRADRVSADVGSRSSTERPRWLRASTKFPRKTRRFLRRRLMGVITPTGLGGWVCGHVWGSGTVRGAATGRGPVWCFGSSRPAAARGARRGLTVGGAGVISGGPNSGPGAAQRTPISEVSREEDVPTASQEPQAHPRVPQAYEDRRRA